jgi:YbgC/YbaW family acyl-CoA thioester hydrolase
LRVSWENTDSAGYIHNSVVFRWFEIGELEWFRALGIPWTAFPDHGFPRIHVEADFRVPLYFEDACVLETRIVRVRAAGFSLAHTIRKDETTAVTGRIDVCCVSARTGRACPLPDAMRTTLGELLPCE